MKNGVWFLAVALVLAGCGGGGGGGSNNALDPRPPTQMQDEETEVTDERTLQETRDIATTSRQNLGSVTQSTNVNGTTNVVLDRVRAKLDDNGDPMFASDDDGDMNIVVENTHQEWEGSNDNGYFQESDPRIGGQGATDDVRIDDAGNYGTPVIDAANLTLKSPSDYESGDYYLVTGLWYEDDRNFGVFADGPELTADLPTSGSATYEGGAFGLYWDRNRLLAGADIFNADVEFQAVASGGNVAISGEADNIRNVRYAGIPLTLRTTPLLENRTIRFEEMTYTPPGIVNGEMVCEPNCRIQGSSWGGQFHGNPPAGGETNGWPFSFNGTFGIQELEYENNAYDILGYFSSVHGDLEDLITDLREGGLYGGDLSSDGGGGGAFPVEPPPPEFPQTIPAPSPCDPSQRELC